MILNCAGIVQGKKFLDLSIKEIKTQQVSVFPQYDYPDGIQKEGFKDYLIFIFKS